MLTKEEAQGRTHKSIKAITEREYSMFSTYVERKIQESINRGKFECHIEIRGYHSDTVEKMQSELRNHGYTVTPSFSPDLIRVAWMK